MTNQTFDWTQFGVVGSNKKRFTILAATDQGLKARPESNTTIHIINNNNIVVRAQNVRIRTRRPAPRSCRRSRWKTVRKSIFACPTSTSNKSVGHIFRTESPTSLHTSSATKRTPSCFSRTSLTTWPWDGSTSSTTSRSNLTTTFRPSSASLVLIPTRPQMLTKR